MFFATMLLSHVLAAIGTGPIFTQPFLANTRTALQAVLVGLRFGGGATLLSGILLWVVLKPVQPLWLYLSSALFVAVLAAAAFVLSPAVKRISGEPKMRGQVRWVGIASSALTLGIAALIVLRPSWS